MLEADEERLSPEEIVQLNEALSDGFRDDYLPGLKLQKSPIGDVFDNNPLHEDAVFLLQEMGFPRRN